MSESHLVAGSDGRPRCRWCAGAPEFEPYHDREWGFPVADDTRLFEKICLEGFQSGLSWRTILAKRENFRRAFEGFDVHRVARFGEKHVARLLQDEGIVRHRGKIEAVINNAKCAVQLQAERGSLAAYFWQFEAKRPAMAQAVSVSPESIALSKDLKKRGWKFVGADHRLRVHAGDGPGERPCRRLRDRAPGGAGAQGIPLAGMSRRGAMQDPADNGRLLSAMTTEHFVLQSANGSTYAEASARSSLYVMALSSSLVAMGFLSSRQDVFLLFAACVLPALFLLGIFTVVRLVETALESRHYLAGMARIRAFYRSLGPEAERQFAAEWGRWPEASSPALRLGPTLAFFGTTASMVAVTNNVVAGAGAALLVHTLWPASPTSVCAAVGVAVALVLTVAFYGYQRWRFSDQEAGEQML
jgi:DNA-3-methyladenine glycosylase I